LNLSTSHDAFETLFPLNGRRATFDRLRDDRLGPKWTSKYSLPFDFFLNDEIPNQQRDRVLSFARIGQKQIDEEIIDRDISNSLNFSRLKSLSNFRLNLIAPPCNILRTLRSE